MFVTLVETWRDSRRQGDNTLLAAALPSLLLAVDAAGQRALLDTVRTLMDKVLCWMPSSMLFEQSDASPLNLNVMRGTNKVFRWCPVENFGCA